MFSIVLQAGGRSTRMGKDKSLQPFLGTPLIVHLRNRFLDLGKELVIISNNPGGYGKLGLPVQGDLIPDRGPLGGLYTALSIASQPLVGLIATDLPFASPDLILYLVGVIQETRADCALPSSVHGIEPLHAVYRRETCLPLVRQALDEDLWRMNSWYDRAKIETVDPKTSQRISGSENTFLNLNTPEDFAAAEGIARRMKDM